MADLSDFIGHILEELTRARVQADRETLRTAEQYIAEENGLLKHFPIPRMRLPNIEITLPVVIDDVPDGYVEKANPEILGQTLATDIQRVLKEKKVHLTINEISKIIESDVQLSQGYLRPFAIDSVTSRISDHIQASAKRKAVPIEAHNLIVTEVRKQIKETLSKLPTKPVGITINPRSSVIKEYFQSPEKAASVVYLKLSITEEAFEMDIDQTRDKPELKRLIPE